MRRVRWVLVGSIALGLLIVTALSQFGGLKLCRHVLATVGTRPVVKVCGPPETSDFLPIAVVLAILIFPDISELTIPGFVGLRRRVDVQAHRQEQVERNLAILQQSVQQLVTVNVFPEGSDTARRRLEEKAQQYE